MVDLGFFAEERIELIDGMLVAMSPQGARHAAIVGRLNMMLVPALLNRAEVRIQSPFAAADDSEPEPDVAVVPRGDYLLNHPGQAHLIVEVADSSSAKDRLVKTRLYARSGVPEYWIIHLPEESIEVYREPHEDRYLQVSRHARGETLALLAFPDLSIATDTLLPEG